MPWLVFESTLPASEQPQSHAPEGTATLVKTQLHIHNTRGHFLTSRVTMFMATLRNVFGQSSIFLLDENGRTVKF
jgi:hypothetical protein